LDNQSVSLNVDELVDVMSAAGQPIQIVPQNTQVAENDADAYEDVKRLVRDAGKASTSLIQRRLRIGYGRASRYMDRLEADRIIGPADGSGPRMILKQKDDIETGSQADDSNESMYEAAVRVSIHSNKSSTSFLQRRLQIGYGRAAKLLELMEQNGIVAAADGSRPRTILITDIDEALKRSRR
jgi:DNA segregation ATPase FtsK/SpoIIIE-like protein